MTPVCPGDRIDYYRIDSLVARGGMASIFRATDTRDGHVVAIKVPHPEAECDPVAFERFQREAMLGRELDHPGVVKVEPNVRSSRFYFAAQWAEGETLRAILEREGRFTSERAVRIALSICDALRYIHEAGIAHRDLKPENIMVDSNDEIKLIDFGLASVPGARRLTFGKFSKLMGTADYISPEQLRGKRGDESSDIYALGAILFEMVAGRAPFEAENPLAAMNRRLIEEADLSEVPENLRLIVRCALSVNPAQRYAGARDFAEDLDRPDVANHATIAMTPKPRKRAWLLSLAAIPASIFALLVYVASRQ